MLKIDKIDITPVQIKLKEPFVISKGPLYYAKNTIVKIYAEGIYGVGECCPYRTIHGETQEGTVAAGKDLASLLLGKSAYEIKANMAILDKALAGNASIKAAFDMALYDLVCKSLGLPLFRFLGGDAHKVIKTDMTVSLLEADRMAAKARAFVDDGFEILKVKLGKRPAMEDVKRIAAIREEIGFDIPIRIDANQGWNLHEATLALTALEEYNIQYCEAPLKAGRYDDMQLLRNRTSIPLMGDETVFTHVDAHQAIAQGCIDWINIKLGKSGGIHHAMKIAAIAEGADMYCQVGSFSETRLGITALTHFAMAWDNVIEYDLDSPLMQSEDPVIGGMIYHNDWTVSVDESPGHGADFDANFLARFETITISS